MLLIQIIIIIDHRHHGTRHKPEDKEIGNEISCREYSNQHPSLLSLSPATATLPHNAITMHHSNSGHYHIVKAPFHSIKFSTSPVGSWLLLLRSVAIHKNSTLAMQSNWRLPARKKPLSPPIETFNTRLCHL